MAKDGVALDKVVLEIESKSGGANKNIDTLAKSLETLKSAIKGGFNNINKLSAALDKLTKSVKGLDKVNTQIQNMGDIVKPLNKLQRIKTPTGLRNAVNNLEKLPEVFAKLDGKALDNIARTSEKLGQALQPLADRMSQISQGYSSLSQMENTYGGVSDKTNKQIKKKINWFGVFKKTLSTTAGLFKPLTKGATMFGNIASKAIKKATSKIKQMGLSLLGTRTIFTATRKAISEYMNMDEELTSTITNIWRALGAQLAPAVEFVINILHYLLE